MICVSLGDVHLSAIWNKCCPFAHYVYTSLLHRRLEEHMSFVVCGKKRASLPVQTNGRRHHVWALWGTKTTFTHEMSSLHYDIASYTCKNSLVPQAKLLSIQPIGFKCILQLVVYSPRVYAISMRLANKSCRSPGWWAYSVAGEHTFLTGITV
jgi:hypothetical protein